MSTSILIERAKREKWEPELSHFSYDNKIFYNKLCYAFIEYGIKDLEVYHPFESLADYDYLTYILNRSEFSNDYITKDPVEGVYEGFKIKDYKYSKINSLIALRLPFETGVGFGWSTYMKLGLSEEDSFTASMFWKVFDYMLVDTHVGNGHLPTKYYDRDLKLKAHIEKLLKEKYKCAVL